MQVVYDGAFVVGLEEVGLNSEFTGFISNECLDILQGFDPIIERVSFTKHVQIGAVYDDDFHVVLPCCSSAFVGSSSE